MEILKELPPQGLQRAPLMPGQRAREIQRTPARR
jgi:hypothetical protein